MAKLSLAETMNSVNEVRTGVPCKTCTVIASLDEDDRAALVSWLDDPNMMTAVICRALDAFGSRVSASSVSRHRRGHV